MQKTQTAVGDDSSRPHTPDHPGTPKIRLFYAGDMDFARPQFASEAPQLELIAVSEAAIRDARKKDATPPVDVAFIDCSSPGINAPWLLDELRRAFPTLPVVVGVDPGRDDAAREAVQLRADDYTVKSPRWLARLPVRLGIVIERQRRLNEADSLKSLEQRLRLIIESAPACLARLASDGTVLALNTAGRALLGVEAGHVVLRKSILPFVSAEHHQALQEFLQRVCRGSAGSLEFVTAGNADSTRFVEASAIPLPPYADKAETALMVLRDVTTRRRLEQSLEHVETIAPVSNAGMAAELEQRLLEIEQQCRQLSEERDRLSHAVEEGNSTVDALARSLEERGLELNDAVAEREGLRRRVDAAESAVVTLQARLDADRLELERLRTEHDRLAHSADHGNASLSDVAQRLDQRTIELNRVEAERDALVSRLQVADATIERLEAQLAKGPAELARLTAERDHLLTTIREDIQPAVAALKQELEKRRVEAVRLASERDMLQESLQEMQSRHRSEIEAALAANGATEARLREAEDQAREKQAIQLQHDELETQLQEWKSECQRLEADRNTLQAERAREAEASAAHERTLRQQHDELVAQLDDLKRDCQRLEDDRQRLEADRLRETEERAALQQALHQQRDELAAELRDAKRTCERLEVDRSTLLASQLRQTEERTALQQAMQQQHDELTAQLHDSKRQRERLESERDMLQASLAELRAIAADNRDAYQLLELQLHDAETARLEASTERDRLNQILADAFEKFNRLRDAILPSKEAR